MRKFSNLKKEKAKADIRLALKKELRGKVDIKALNNILAEIMEQAEGSIVIGRGWSEILINK